MRPRTRNKASESQADRKADPPAGPGFRYEVRPNPKYGWLWGVWDTHRDDFARKAERNEREALELCRELNEAWASGKADIAIAEASDQDKVPEMPAPKPAEILPDDAGGEQDSSPPPAANDIAKTPSRASSSRLVEMVMRGLFEDFERNGREVIAALRKDRPLDYIKIAAAIPRGGAAGGDGVPIATEAGEILSALDAATADVFAPLRGPARYKGAWGGRGSGKSHFFAALLVRDSIREKGLLSVCIREIQKSLKDSAKRLIEAKLIEHGLGEAQGFKIFRETIQTPGDGAIVFQGMQDHTAESIKSLEGFRRAWVEEAQTLSPGSLTLLRPTIRAPGSEMWFSWNPRRRTDPIDVMLRGPEKPTGAVVVQANWPDNPWFPAELEQERQDCLRMQPDQYDHIWEGGYVSVAAGAYYAACLAEAKAAGRIGKVAFDPLMKVRLMFDIGGTGARADACSIWPMQYIGREIRTRDYYEAVGQPLATHVAWLKGKGYGPDRAEIYLPHDGATNDRVYSVSYESALRDAGYSVRVIPNQGKGAAAARVEAGRRLFGSVWFDEETTEAGRAALGWYHERKDEARNIGLGPEHDWSSHGADSFGLGCVAYEAPQESRRPPRYVRERYCGEGDWMG